MPLLFIVVVGLPIVLYGIIGFLLILDFLGVLLVAVCGGLPLLGLYTNAMGQKIAWDEARVYMRPPGWYIGWKPPWLRRLPWRSLAYDEIESLDALVVNDPGAKSFLLPFQLLRLTAPGASVDFDERHIWFYSLSLKDKELAPLLRQLDTKCPGMLPDIVRERLAKWADNDR